MAAFVPAGGISTFAGSTSRADFFGDRVLSTHARFVPRRRSHGPSTDIVAIKLPASLPSLPSLPSFGKPSGKVPPRKSRSTTVRSTVRLGSKEKELPKFYDSTCARYYFRRGAEGQGYTAYDVRIGENGAKTTNDRVNDQQTFRNMDLYTDPLVWARPNWSPEEATLAVRTVYRNILGNAHLFRSDLESLAYSESCVRSNGNIKEFVRAVGLSELYRSRFFTPCSQMRFVELNFKHFLGRAPRSQEEVSKHIQILANEGYEAEINSYIDSEEYDSLWGETRVPEVNFRGGHNTDQEMNKLAVLNGTYCQSDSVAKSARFPVGYANLRMTPQSVNKGLPPAWRGENAGRDAAGLANEFSLEKFWNVLPYGLKDDRIAWTSRYGVWNRFYYGDSIVFKDIVTPRTKVTDEEAAEADAYLKYGSLMADKYVGVRKTFNVAPVIEIRLPSSSEAASGFVSIAMKDIVFTIPPELEQKV